MRGLRLLVPLLMVCFAFPGLADAEQHTNTSSDREVSLEDWMDWVPDGTRLSELSLPGTHDTMAYQGGGILASSVRTQSLTLWDQLASGVRALDIRIRHIEDRFSIHHDRFYLDAVFGADVLDTCERFLQLHPNETIVMRIQEEHDAADNTRTLSETFQWYLGLYRNVIWKQTDSVDSSNPTLGETRGKIVLAHDTDMGSQANHLAYENFEIQDEFGMDSLDEVEGKINDVVDHFALTEAGSADDFYVNFLSANVNDASDAVFGAVNPRNVAQGALGRPGVNDKILNFLLLDESQTRTGIVFMDYPGGGLISAVVARNFKFQSTPAYYAHDFETVMDQIGASLKDECDDRIDGARSFLETVIPNLYWSVACSATDDDEKFGSSIENDTALSTETAFEDGHKLIAYATTKTSTDYLDVEISNVFVTHAFRISRAGDDTAQERADALAEEFRTRLPRAKWTVICRKSPGGFSNWAFSMFGDGHFQWFDEDDRKYAFVVRGVDTETAPSNVSAGGPYRVVEGTPVEFKGSATDANGDQLYYQWDTDGDRTFETFNLPFGTSTRLWNDDFQGTATLRVTDGIYTVHSKAPVEVINADPTFEATFIEGVPGTFALALSFDDVGLEDTHVVDVTWGDGTTMSASVDDTTQVSRFFSATGEFAGLLEASHSFAANGTRTVSITVTDDDGGSLRRTYSLDVTLDDDPPVITFPDHTTETQDVAQDVYNLHIRVDDASEKSVRVYAPDGTLLNEASGLPADTIFRNVLVNLPDGAHNILVVATDARGNASEATARIVLDGEKPVVAFAQPLDGAILGPNDLPLSFEVHVDDVSPTQGSAMGITTINLPSGGGTATGVVTTLVDGENTLSAFAIDPFGRAGTAKIAVFYDGTAPVPAFVVPEDVVVTSLASVNATATDDAGVTSMLLLMNGQQVATSNTDSIAFDTSALTDGTYRFEAVATDNVGNVGTVRKTVVIDNGAPTKEILTPSDCDVVFGTIAIRAQAEDANLASLTLFVDGVEIGSSPVSPISVDYDTTLRPDGPMAITLVAKDSVGNMTSCVIHVESTNTRTVKIVPRMLRVGKANPRKHGQANVTAKVFGRALEAVLAGTIELRIDGAAFSVFAGSTKKNRHNDRAWVRFDREGVREMIRSLGTIPSSVLVSVYVDGRQVGSDLLRIKTPKDVKKHKSSKRRK